MLNLSFITGNANKADQLAQWFDHPIEYLKLDLDEIQTTSIEKLITHKTKQAFQKLQQLVLVEDVGLTFHAFGNLPGPFIKFFEKELGLEKCCRTLDPFKDRSATGTVTYGLTQDGISVKIFQGQISGKIAEHPAGAHGFGWDAIFIPNGYSLTRAELSAEDYEKTSPRLQAIQKLAAYLTTI